MITLAATIIAGGLLVKFLYIVLAILIIGCLIWAINTYIAPIPQPILVVVAVIMVILIGLSFFGQPIAL